MLALRLVPAKQRGIGFAPLGEEIVFRPEHSEAGGSRFEHLLRFLLDTGCRLGEALGVREQNLGDINGVIYVTFPRYMTKSDKPRTLPLSSEVTASLPYLRANAVDSRLFPLKPQTAWCMWKTIRQDVYKQSKLDISKVVLHTFRDTSLTRLTKSGVRPKTRRIWRISRQQVCSI